MVATPFDNTPASRVGMQCMTALMATATHREVVDIIRAESVRDLALVDDTPLTRNEPERAPEDQPWFDFRRCRNVRLGDWASEAAVQPPFGRVLYRIASAIGGTALEFGTGASVSSAYLAAGLQRRDGSCVISVDPDETLSRQARRRLRQIGFTNVSLIVGQQEDMAEGLLMSGRPRVVHLDSDHRRSTTTELLRRIASVASYPIVVCMDDIRWSRGMERIWDEVRSGEYGATHAFDLGLWGVAVLHIDSSAACRTLEMDPPRGFGGGAIRP